MIQVPDLVDAETPQSAHSRTGFDGNTYELIFSDEFNTPGRAFYLGTHYSLPFCSCTHVGPFPAFPGDDPFWEAVDIWYGSTTDLEWYDP